MAPRFTRKEQALVQRLRTPLQVQAWLDALPYNWERHGPTARTFRGVVQHGTAHCFEAALTAAAILEQHGYPPTLLDLESIDGLDHVLLLYQQDGKWGTVARSRCIGLNGRKPVFASVPDLVRSYMAPFVDTTGRIKAYGVLDLRDLPTGTWRTGNSNVPHVEQALRDLPHKRLPTPEPEFRKWKARYDAWWEKEGRPAHHWPDFPDFPQRATWLGPGL